MREQSITGGTAGGVKTEDADLDENALDEMTDAVGMAMPNYASDEARQLGERLNALYVKRAKKASKTLTKEINSVRALQRRGPRLHPGEFLVDGRYRLLDRLGHDAVDGRWQAWDAHTGGPVHILIMHGEWVLQDALVDAFIARSNKLAEWDHQGIAQILDSGRNEEGFVYVVTEFMGPVDLHSAILAEESLSDIAAVQAMLEVAEALQGAHTHGAVHGAVNPANVVMAFDGSAHLTNFDLQDASRSGPMGGLYNAPESLERNATRSAQADVYSWGMTTIFALYRQELPFWVLRDAGRLVDALEVSQTLKDLLKQATEWDLEARLKDTHMILERIYADADLVRELADHAYEKGRYEVAAAHYARLLKLDVDDVVALNTRLGDIHTRMKSWDASIQHLGRALELAVGVDSETAAQETAEPIFGLLARWATATEGWSQVARLLWDLARKSAGGHRAFLRAELARINQHELGDPTAAAETWQQVHEDHHTPELGGRALSALRQLAADRKDWDQYVKNSTMLLPHLPEDERPEVEYAIGRAYLNQIRDDERAVLWLSRAESNGRSTLELAPKLEQIYAARGDWPKVIELMLAQAVGQKDSEASRTLLRAGLIAQSVHLEDLAIEVYDTLLDRVSDHTVALRNLARIRHRGHDVVETIRVFERLCGSYGKRKVVEPEASERAGDLTALALLLLQNDQRDKGVKRLHEALKLNPNLVPALEVAGPLFLMRGEVEDAGNFYDRLHTLFRSMDRSATKIDACLGMGDVAWLQGRLTEALGWYNRALETDSLSPLAWWGVAKCAMAARAGHPGAERAPWLCSVPSRFTPQEALARLFMGILDPTAMAAWLKLGGMGQQLLTGGEIPARLACGLVDVMQRQGLIDPDLFGRLSTAYPDWQAPIEVVQGLWYGTGAELDAASTYPWSRRELSADFDVEVRRSVLSLNSPKSPIQDGSLREESAWTQVMGGATPPSPDFSVITKEPMVIDDLEGVKEAVLRNTHGVWLVLSRTTERATVGSDETSTWRLEDAESSHLTLTRVGPHVYVEVHGPTQIDGAPVERCRLVGGETLSLAGREVTFQWSGTEAPVESTAVEPQREDTPVSEPEAGDNSVSEAHAVSHPRHDEAENDTVISPVLAPAQGVESPSKQHADTILSAMKRATPAPSPDRGVGADTSPPPVDSDLSATEEGGADTEVEEPEADPVVSEDTATESEDEVAEPPETAADYVAPPMLMEDVVSEDAGAVDETEDLTEPAPSSGTAEPSVPDSRPSADVVSTEPPGGGSPDGSHTLVPPQSLFMPINLDAPPQSAPPAPAPVSVNQVRALVEFMSGPSRGNATEIGTVVSIGSGDVDLQISGDSRVEAEHCTISRRGEDEFVATDCDSGIGTFVNGAPISTLALRGGEVIMVGKTVLRFRIVD